MVFEGLWEGVIAMAAVGAVFFVVYAKAAKNNPKINEFLAQFNPGRLYEKMPEVPPVKEKIEQIYEERRKLI